MTLGSHHRDAPKAPRGAGSPQCANRERRAPRWPARLFDFSCTQRPRRNPGADRSPHIARLLGGLALGLALACGLAGCSTPSSEPHGHGSRPPHKPDSFQAAVMALESRWAALTQSDRAESEETRDGEARDGESPRKEMVARKREFLDIVGWLLELAADTDLPRADWDAVAAGARRLERKLAPTGADATAWKPDRDVLAELATLKRLAAQSPSEPPR